MTLDYLWRFSLRRGNSTDPTNGACLLDAVTWFEFGHLGDHPPCTCPVQAAYGRVLNDSLDDVRRQVLRGYVTRLVGTLDPPSEFLRAEYAVRRTIREVLPIVLEARGFSDHARCCVELSPDATVEECRAAADYAANAAVAAANAAATDADAVRIYDVALSIFDGMLRIGRQSDPVLPARVRAVNDGFAEASRSCPTISLSVA